jgi:hypothetical protein
MFSATFSNTRPVLEPPCQECSVDWTRRHSSDFPLRVAYDSQTKQVSTCQVVENPTHVRTTSVGAPLRWPLHVSRRVRTSVRRRKLTLLNEIRPSLACWRNPFDENTQRETGGSASTIVPMYRPLCSPDGLYRRLVRKGRKTGNYRSTLKRRSVKWMPIELEYRQVLILQTYEKYSLESHRRAVVTF